MISELPLIPLVLLGAVLALDVVSFPQAMISRPLVAATIGGLIVGDASAGLLIGAVLELIAMETLPVGASRYPEWGSASVVAGAVFASISLSPPGALAVTVLAGIATAWVGGGTIYLLRRVNGAVARRLLESGAPVTADMVVRLQLLGLGADLVRGALITFVALLLVPPFASVLLARWGAAGDLSRAVVIGVAIAVAAAATWRLFAATRGGIVLFAGGIVVSLLVLGLV